MHVRTGDEVIVVAGNDKGATGAVRSGRSVGEDAAVGAILGGAKGLNEGDRDQVRVVKNCLRGRGYRVLN